MIKYQHPEIQTAYKHLILSLEMKNTDIAQYFYNSMIKELFCLQEETFDSA